MSRRRLAALMILGLVALLVAFAGYKAIKVLPPLVSLRGHVATLESLAARPGDLDERAVGQAAQALRGLHDDLETLYGEFALVMPALRHLSWMPAVGGDLAALPDLAEMGLRLTDAGAVIAEAFAPHAAPVFQARATGRAEDALPALLAVLPAMQPALAQAQAEVEAAAVASARIDRASLSPTLARQVARLDAALPFLQLGLVVAQNPDLLGGNGPRTYLILAQNSDELRATGGYIGGVGVLTVDQGQIAELRFLNTYGVDDLRHEYYPDAPPDLYDTMLAYQWLFRDGNWSPDYPTSAQTLVMLYEKGQKQRVDGVIAVDLYAVQLFIEAVGPLRAERFDEPVTGENAIAALRRAWEPESGQLDPEWYKHHKDFMGTLSQAMLERVLNNPATLSWSRVTTAMAHALQEKHVLIYVSNPPLARFLADHGWDGAMRQTDGDFLAVVDSNVGFNKASPLIDESIAYRVDLTDADNPRGAVSLSYRSRAEAGESPCVQDNTMLPTYRAMMNRCYWGYVRVYAPLGSALVTATPAPLPEGSLWARKGGGTPGQDTVRVLPAEAGKTGWGAFFVLPPQASQDLSFAYELPISVLRREGDVVYYSLWVQKQAGTDGWPVTVTVELPPGARLWSASPEPTARSGQVVTFEFRLSEDRRIQVCYRR